MLDPETKRYIDQQIETLRREIRGGGIVASGGASGKGANTVAYAVSAGHAEQAEVAVKFGGTTISFDEDWTDE